MVGGLQHQQQRWQQWRGPNAKAPPSARIPLLERLMKGSWRFDQARNPGAWEMQQHLLQDVDVCRLKQTHGDICRTFRHGVHKGQAVTGLTEKLLAGTSSVRDLPALLAVRLSGQYWVVFGNRRLKALKAYQERSWKQVRARCVVYDIDTGPIPSSLLAKFLASASTTNGGAHAPFRL